MQVARTEERFSSATAGGVVLGPYALNLQGDGPKRSFNCVVTNVGRDSDAEDMVFKAQEAESADGPWTDVAAGSKTIKVRVEEQYAFYVKGASTHFRFYASGKTQGVFQVFDNDDFANAINIGEN